MKAEIKEQWLKDLRSGDFAQVEGSLSDGEGYCCLGVLCEQAVNAGVIGKIPTDDEGVRYGTEDEFSFGALPQPVVEWAELDSVDPAVEGEISYEDYQGDMVTETVNYNLSSWNDEEHKNFAEIADLIEKGL